MSAYCRFEILLPLRYNDGRAVPRGVFADTAFEIQHRFGGVTWEQQVIEGFWRQEGVQFHDKLNRIFVDVEDTTYYRKQAVLHRVKGKAQRTFRAARYLGDSSPHRDTLKAPAYADPRG